uniref:Uncharacterized protein n=1 Tax=Anguilla anguilla TaxID=7936 RepID=A0A0E9UZF5_ANGAN
MFMFNGGSSCKAYAYGKGPTVVKKNLHHLLQQLKEKSFFFCVVTWSQCSHFWVLQNLSFFIFTTFHSFATVMYIALQSLTFNQ